ncbi:heterokaryon incompatibility protein-domain-containing protein [Cercophora samala]|uniref:Heterokaryon incompatibility protein-domain-containing protein n=1 Tax=Cercophora samala TaxID=330535 RepID=A0AA39ZK93_9PEZI|nr:heterokaryon incompatibility protein-domain-containing protein [Cercophora samala]
MNYYMYPSDDSGIDVSELEDSVINGIQNKGTPTDGLGINDSRPDNIGKKDISKDNIGKNGFFYAPINLGRPQIRLLRILKGRNSSISCELFQALVERRDGAIPYEAISYVWGSPERERQVLINGTLFGVTRNLYQILCSLQLEDEDRIVWVDAICIDQTNEVERGHQVQHMGDVYKQAVRVIYWLGSPTYMTNWCLHSLRLLQEETKDLEIKAWTKERWMIAWKSLKSGSRHRPALACKGLEELLDRPWFRRVWILQEVANSQSAVISCGKTSVSAKIFTLAPFLMGVYPGPHRQAILDMMPGPFRGSTWFSGSRDLYTLIDHFGASETTEERDLIYALLGMSSDAVHVIHPDYQKSEDEVLNVVFHFLFQRSPHRMSRSPQSLRDFCLRVRYFQDLVMQDVAGNVVNGDALMAFSLRCHPCFSISEQTIKIAAKNRQKGSRIIQVILCHLDRRSQKPTRGQVDALIEGAAANDFPCHRERPRSRHAQPSEWPQDHPTSPRTVHNPLHFRSSNCQCT